MPARTRRTLLVPVVVLAVAMLAVPSTAFATPSRMRPDRGPAPMPVVGVRGGGSRPSSVAVRSATPVSARRAVSGAAASASVRSPADVQPAPAPIAFDALSHQGTGNYPADPTGALGAQVIVTAVNTSVAVYDRATQTPLFAPKRLATFFPKTPGERFDPKVVYDQYAQAFVLTFLVRRAPTKRSWIMTVTIPDDSTMTDTSGWCGVRFDGDTVKGNGRQWADYTEVGYDGNSFAIDTNAFTFGGGYAYAQIYYVSNPQLFGACNRTKPVRFHAFTGTATLNPDGRKAFTIQPAQTEGTTNQQYFLSWDPTGFVVEWRLRETAHGLRLTNAAIRAAPVLIAPFGTQKGGSYSKPRTWWDPGDLRFVNAWYDAHLNRLYAAHAIARDLRPDTAQPDYVESAIRWYEVRPAERLRASRITRTGIIGQPDTDAGWPMMATDGLGNVFVTFSRASKPEGEYLSAWAAEIPPGTTKAQLMELKPGNATMNASLPSVVQRWGDFNGIDRDPTDNRVIAMVNQYAKAPKPGKTFTRDWQQTMAFVQDGP